MSKSIRDLQTMTEDLMELIPDVHKRSIYFDISKLAEECGEVAETFNKTKFTNKDRGEELADVVRTCLWLASRSGIDLEKAIMKKHKAKVARFIEKWHNGIYPAE